MAGSTTTVKLARVIVSLTLTACPQSAATSLYVIIVAPGIATLSRNHWYAITGTGNCGCRLPAVMAALSVFVAGLLTVTSAAPKAVVIPGPISTPPTPTT